MKSRDVVLKVSRFEVAEQRRKLADLEIMINDFKRMASDLDAQIEAEHIRSGVRDPSHFSYSPFAKAARQRRDNLLTSVADLSSKLDAAKLDLGQAEEEFQKLSSGHEAEERPTAARVPVNRGRANRSSAFRPSPRSM
jgi:flagellar protein FliJ